jgi:phosphomannomutase
MNYQAHYAQFLATRLKLKRPLRVVFDSSNGTTGPILNELLKLKAISHKLKATTQNARPDGRFPAHGPDPWQPGAMNQLKIAVKKFKADCGIIFDADGDRVFFIDDRGRQIDPDHVAILVSKNLSGPVILDQRMGYAIRDFLKKQKRPLIEGRTGHTLIKRAMRESQATFGAETSGHYYFKSFFYADAGIFAAIKFLNTLAGLDQSLADWVDQQPKYFRSGELNFKVVNKEKIIRRIEAVFKKSARRISKLDGLRMEFQNKIGCYWFGIRASNTENLLRLNIETSNQKLLNQVRRRITTLIRASK